MMINVHNITNANSQLQDGSIETKLYLNYLQALQTY